MKKRAKERARVLVEGYRELLPDLSAEDRDQLIEDAGELLEAMTNVFRASGVASFLTQVIVNKHDQFPTLLGGLLVEALSCAIQDAGAVHDVITEKPAGYA